MKKILCLILLFFSVGILSATADGMVSITADKSFFRYSENPERVAEILSMPADSLTKYCNENSIAVLAVNDDNTAQIRVSAVATALSAEVDNLSYLDNAEAQELAGKLTSGNHRIVTKDGQRFIRTAGTLSDSGGDYGIIQYITVAGGKIYTLSFYTSAGKSDAYATDVFQSYECEDFIEADTASGFDWQSLMIMCGIIIFSAASVFIVYTIIRDLKSGKTE